MPTAVWSHEPTTTVRGTLTLRMTFDEPVTGFAAGDLRLRRTSDNTNYVPTSAQTTLTDLGSNVWQVEITDLETLLGQQNSEFLLRLRARSVFFDTSQTNGPNGARDSATFTIDTNPVADPVAISAFANQNVTINTDMALDINITGNPDSAWIEGNLEGFHSFWDDPTLQVRGTGTRLINNELFTVYAKKGTDDPVTRRGTFSVLPAAPVITTLPRQTLYRGNPNEIIVPISNNPALVRAKSKWFGMKYEPHPEGIRIFGDVPSAADGDLSFDSGVIEVLAQTGELIDEGEIEFNVSDGIAPSWLDIPDPYTRNVGDTFRLILPNHANGLPTPIITHESGTIPPGLELTDDYNIEGSFETAGTYAPIFRATNGNGTAVSEPVDFTIRALAAPRFLGTNIPNITITRRGELIIDASTYFDLGVPNPIPSVSGVPSDLLHLFSGGDVHASFLLSDLQNYDGETYTCILTLTNTQGNARSNQFTINVNLV